MDELNKMKGIPKADQAGGGNTIYDVAGWQIFWRNFVAGMGRALGSVIMYLVFVYVIYELFVRFLLPTVKPVIDGYMKMVNSLGLIDQLNEGVSPVIQLSPEDVEQLIESTPTTR